MTTIIYPSSDVLAEMTIARLCLALADAGAQRSAVHLAIAGGSVGQVILTGVAASPLAAHVDWSAVHVWWVDERFVPAGDDERNDATLTDVFSALPLPAENIHRVPPEGDAATVADSASRYAAVLRSFAPEGEAMPVFDVVLLGMGPDGHVASLFPGHPGLLVDSTGLGEVTLAVTDSPKPPASRVSLSLPAVNNARRVWIAAWGEEKAPAIAAAVAGVDVNEIPAAGVGGIEETLWLTDIDGASRL